MKKARVYIGLLHYPMYNKNGAVITTSVTNLDVHDIARTARTYEVEQFFIIHPSAKQQEMLQVITSYWQEGYGVTYNADRNEALQRVSLCKTLTEVQEEIEREVGMKPILVATDAKPHPQTVSYTALREQIFTDSAAYLILFGTGWGMTEELIAGCDLILPPIEAADSDYNHLSVRSAVAIIIDRLLGEKWFSF